MDEDGSNYGINSTVQWFVYVLSKHKREIASFVNNFFLLPHESTNLGHVLDVFGVSTLYAAVITQIFSVR